MRCALDYSKPFNTVIITHAEDLDLVIRETKRCAGIIRRLLDFSREKTPEKAYGNLNNIIEETLKLIEQNFES